MIRNLSESTTEPEPILWHMIYTLIILVGMFVFLILDIAGADMIMVGTLTLFMVSGIITVNEGVAGFSNQDILTVMSLFIVAAGVGHTGALDWYMGKLLGRPKKITSSQLRLVVPICLVSAFLNNTLVVALMIPIVQRWALNIGISAQQLLIPLSYACILGGTSTLIGTSTNLVVLGLYQMRYPDQPPIGLFDLSIYGIPVAMIGTAYILLCSPCLLPGSKEQSNDADDAILLKARLTKRSFAAGRSVERSGLRDTGGVYLVSVQRSATGNIHRAVDEDFILNIGDILYFTGLVEGFGEFCDDHGLELVTNEDQANAAKSDVSDDSLVKGQVNELSRSGKESMLKIDATERLRCVNRITDLIRGFVPSEPIENALEPIINIAERISPKEPKALFSEAKPPIVIVVEENTNYSSIILVAIDALDRTGLLQDISKSLLQLNLKVHSTEASVQYQRSLSAWRCPLSGHTVNLEEISTVYQRSLSVWRCAPLPGHTVDLKEISNVLNSLMENGAGRMEAIKKRGLQVIRAKINEHSTLIGKQVKDVNFRLKYNAAIVSVLKGDTIISTEALSDVMLSLDDVLILQVNNDSPLLVLPDEDFYSKLEKRKFSFVNILNFVRTTKLIGEVNKMTSIPSEKFKKLTDSPSGENKENNAEHIVELNTFNDAERNDCGAFVDIEKAKNPIRSHSMPRENAEKENQTRIWIDLQVLTPEENQSKNGVEFLTAMQVSNHSKLASKTVLQLGFNKLPNIFLVSIERPIDMLSVSTRMSLIQHFDENCSFTQYETPTNATIDVDEPLQPGDILWFSGPANAVGELRKIPGLVQFESEEIKQIEGKVSDRRLVQAVVARTGPLVGKTVVEVKFRTKYGAAVIAIHREGKKIMEHPGQVKMHAGDVLLLEAGPAFFERNTSNDRAFVLLSEVEDSSPPRLKLFIPALALMIAMLALYTAGLGSLLVFALLASMIMIFIGVLSEQEARDAVNWEIYVTIACAFGIGAALTNSGVEDKIANGLVHIGTSLGSGDAGLFAAVYLATFLISSVVTNNAAAALMFPIAMNAAEKTGTSVVLMNYNLMLAASASFMTPFGYQTNLMVYGPGKYKTKDFLKFGTPLQIVLWLFNTAILTFHKQVWISWVASISILVLTSIFMISIR